MSKIPTQLRLNKDLHKRLKEIAEQEYRSLNSQMEYFIMKGIEDYEKQKKD